MHLAMVVQVQTRCYITIVDAEHHMDVETSLDVEDLDIVCPQVLVGIPIVEGTKA